jgi:hypothetical protein
VPNPVGLSQSTPTALLADGVGHHQLLVLGVQPGLGHHARGRRGADVLGELGELAVVLGGEQALFDANFANRDFERLEVADFVHHRARGIAGAL